MLSVLSETQRSSLELDPQLPVSWDHTRNGNREQIVQFSSWIKPRFLNLHFFFSPLGGKSYFQDRSPPSLCSLDVRLFPCLRLYVPLHMSQLLVTPVLLIVNGDNCFILL